MKLALALLVLRVLAQAIQPFAAAHQFAILAHCFYAGSYFHIALAQVGRPLGRGAEPKKRPTFLIPVDNAATGTIRGELQGDLVAHQDLDVPKSHFPGQVSEDDGAVLELDTERGVG